MKKIFVFKINMLIMANINEHTVTIVGGKLL